MYAQTYACTHTQRNRQVKNIMPAAAHTTGSEPIKNNMQSKHITFIHIHSSQLCRMTMECENEGLEENYRKSQKSETIVVKK